MIRIIINKFPRFSRSYSRLFSYKRMDSQVEPIIVYVTVPNETEGDKIASQLVSNKLAACVNIIGNVKSVYTWEGKIQKDSELLLMIKTKKSVFEQLKAKVKELHPYDVPEVISVKITDGLDEYIKWIGDSTK